MAKSKGGGVTSAKVAKKASDLLSNEKSPAKVKSVSASALSNAANKKSGKKKS